ncbi:Aldose sugar dehydrogenase YliI [Pontiella desulfatans]|uniref:Aldose sugar dehydrogenase YliI n=1 Tax=Pontiella desulfatans TaxID=2750659 RepID=A0A6C2UCS6_PONDE|nr:PQQ-dependent sugar dehydrogenase [Pontiella desulfatans]VGO17915.1 Aldose sugar dehydrogenase YliI [Pontiella desulfatans]
MKAKIILPILLTVSSALGQSADNLYQEHCSHCHGAKFQGGNAQSLIDGIWQFGDSAGHISRNIKFGITHLGMPAYEKSLTDPQIKSLVNYLFEAEKQAGAATPPSPTSLQTQDYDIDVEIWAEGLDIPWNLAFLDDKLALITERPGRLRIMRNGTLNPKPVEGSPSVVAEGQGGLLAVAFDPDYREKGNQWIYLAFSHGLEKKAGEKRAPAMTKVVRGRIRNNRWIDEQTLFEARHEEYRTTRVHFGTRIVFDAGNNLYFSIGDRGTGDDAQDLSKPNGKMHRIRRDGSIPNDNPFVQTEGALPSIFSYGHRNPQGISVHPTTGQIWAAEHGPLGGDELNLVEAGKNYGWPVITYGKNYNGTTITEVVRKEGMEQPAWYWKPSTAVCGIGFYSGNLFPKWNNKLLVGALKYEDVRVLDIEKDRVMHEEMILKNAGRVRDVACGPDGALYIVLNSPDTILRLTPKEQ